MLRRFVPPSKKTPKKNFRRFFHKEGSFNYRKKRGHLSMSPRFEWL